MASGKRGLSISLLEGKIDLGNPAWRCIRLHYQGFHADRFPEHAITQFRVNLVPCAMQHPSMGFQRTLKQQEEADGGTMMAAQSGWLYEAQIQSVCKRKIPPGRGFDPFVRRSFLRPHLQGLLEGPFCWLYLKDFCFGDRALSHPAAANFEDTHL